MDVEMSYTLMLTKMTSIRMVTGGLWNTPFICQLVQDPKFVFCIWSSLRLADNCFSALNLDDSRAQTFD